MNINISIESVNKVEAHEIKKIIESFCDTIPRYIESIQDDVHAISVVLEHERGLKHSIKELLMTIQQDLADFASQVDAVTNTIAANVTVVAKSISDLQAQIAAGTITDADVAAALDPVKANLQTVSDSLAAVAAGGTPAVTPVASL